MSAGGSRQLCWYADDPERFLALLSAMSCPFADPVSFPLASRYYADYFGAAYRGDASLIEHNSGIPTFVMRAQAVNRVLSDNGQDVSIFVAGEQFDATYLVDLIEAAARRTDCDTIRILDDVSAGTISSLGHVLMYRKAVPQARVQAMTDLAMSESQLRGGLRKSYRSLVNWGLKSFRFQDITCDSFDAAAFESFRQFHIRTSGRETRSTQSWAIQAEMIKAGRGELLLSFLDGARLVGGSLFLDTGDTTTYGVGVYERSMFDKPLAHAPIFRGMLRARERKQRRFVIGDVPPARSAQDKEFSIGWFKSGFTEHLAVGLDWTYKLDFETRKNPNGTTLNDSAPANAGGEEA